MFHSNTKHIQLSMLGAKGWATQRPWAQKGTQHRGVGRIRVHSTETVGAKGAHYKPKSKGTFLMAVGPFNIYTC